MNGHMVTQTETSSTVSPVCAMTVPGGCDACACTPHIGVIDVDGFLTNADMSGLGSFGENPVSLFREKLDAAADDPCCCGVVVRINSPGGGVTASDVMWHDLMMFKENKRVPVIASIMDLGTGGAYLIATAADQIIVHPTSVIGGLGVIFNSYSVEGSLEKFDIKYNPVLAKDAEMINIGVEARTIRDEKTVGERAAVLKAVCNDHHQRLKSLVLQSRVRVDSEDKTNFDGRIMTAQDSLCRQLVDQVGYLDDAINTVRTLTNQGSAQVVMYHRTNDRPRSPYAVTPNVPLNSSIMPVSMPGLDRAKLPQFLYMWQPEPTMEKLGGR
jgi:protease-4